MIYIIKALRIIYLSAFFSRVFPENKLINVLINSKMHNIWCESLAILPLTCFLAVWYNIGVENIWEV